MAPSSFGREAPFQEKIPRKISIETFLRKYRKGGAGIKYEFNKGIIEKTDSMRFGEQYIADNIQKAFELTQASAEGSRLVQELEIWTARDQWRKPDICLITPAQIKAAASGKEPVPVFIIEVISKNDAILVVKDKVFEYFKAGVQMLWHVFPHNNKVEIYYSAYKSETFEGDQICSAEAVVPGFKMTASSVFELP